MAYPCLGPSARQVRMARAGPEKRPRSGADDTGNPPTTTSRPIMLRVVSLVKRHYDRSPIAVVAFVGCRVSLVGGRRDVPPDNGSTQNESPRRVGPDPILGPLPALVRGLLVRTRPPGPQCGPGGRVSPQAGSLDRVGARPQVGKEDAPNVPKLGRRDVLELELDRRRPRPEAPRPVGRDHQAHLLHAGSVAPDV